MSIYQFYFIYIYIYIIYIYIYFGTQVDLCVFNHHFSDPAVS